MAKKILIPAVFLLLLAVLNLPAAFPADETKEPAVQVVVLALDRLDDWKKSGSEEKSLALIKGMDLTCAWADEETFYQYGSFDSVPTVFLIDKSGKIVAQVPADGRDQEQLARRIAALL